MLFHPHWLALLACLFLVQLIQTNASQQQAYYNGPNEDLTPLVQAQTYCGECPNGTVREFTSGPYCGRCLPCTFGHYMRNGQCEPCPCPGTRGDRKFGKTCSLDVDGQVTCDCPSEYTGRDCSQCATGTIQNNQYPYNCIRANSTNSFNVSCPVSGLCVQEISCTFGYYLRNGQCESCPCPGKSRARKFGTTCRVDVDGQVTCDCPRECYKHYNESCTDDKECWVSLGPKVKCGLQPDYRYKVCHCPTGKVCRSWSPEYIRALIEAEKELSAGSCSKLYAVSLMTTFSSFINLYFWI